MVRVFSELCKIDSDARLLLVGDGLLFENVKEQLKSLGLTDKVTFTGRQTDAYNYMMAMDIYLMPSHFEGFGINKTRIDILNTLPIKSTIFENLCPAI